MTNSKRINSGGLLVVLISYLAFISLGLPDGLLGVSWPFISSRHNIPLDSLGILLISFVAGYLSTSTTTGKILSALPVGLLLTISCLITGVSLLTYAYAELWILVIIATFSLGAGGGAIDTSINTFAASAFSPSVVNWLHAFYGIGATAGPFLITWMLVHEHSWFHGYLVVGIVQVGLSVLFLTTLRYWKMTPGNGGGNVKTGTYAEAFRIPTFWLSVMIFFIYTGLEMGVGQWAFTILTRSREIPEERAGLWTSAYWASLTAGRIVFGFVLTRIRVHHVLTGAFAGIVVGTLLFAGNALPALALAGIIVIGFSNAPVFPCLISLTPRQVGEQQAGNMIGFQISAALVGGALLPALAGWATDYFGWEVIPFFFIVEALILFILYMLVSRSPAVMEQEKQSPQ